MQTRSPSLGEKSHASAAMASIVCDDTADLMEESLSCDTEHKLYVPRDLAAYDHDTQEPDVRATTRRGSPVQAFSYQTDDMDEITFAASASASGAVTRR